MSFEPTTSCNSSTYGGEMPNCVQCLLWLVYQMDPYQYTNLELTDTGAGSGYFPPLFHQLQKLIEITVKTST